MRKRKKKKKKEKNRGEAAAAPGRPGTLPPPPPPFFTLPALELSLSAPSLRAARRPASSRLPSSVVMREVRESQSMSEEVEAAAGGAASAANARPSAGRAVRACVSEGGWRWFQFSQVDDQRYAAFSHGLGGRKGGGGGGAGAVPSEGRGFCARRRRRKRRPLRQRRKQPHTGSHSLWGTRARTHGLILLCRTPNGSGQAPGTRTH